MIVYEVQLEVDRELGAEYLAWLRAHVDAMLALPGFLGAELEAVEQPEDAPRLAWSVRYRLHDRQALEAYLEHHAAAMRADGERRFGGRFRASRRILQPLATIGLSADRGN